MINDQFLLPAKGCRKVPRRPGLEDLDRSAKCDSQPDVAHATSDLGAHVVFDNTSTHERDKALLSTIGVDGSVSLEQARINAGLPANGVRPPRLHNGRWVAANDNHNMAANAA